MKKFTLAIFSICFGLLSAVAYAGNNSGSAQSPASGFDTAIHYFLSWFPMLLLIGVWIFFMRKTCGTGAYMSQQQFQTKIVAYYEEHLQIMREGVATMKELTETLKKK